MLSHLNAYELAVERRLGPADATAWDRRVESWEVVARSAAFHRLAEAICERAAPRPDDRVVDLGAGTGLLALALAPSVASVSAVDSSPAMLERLRKKAEESEVRNVHPALGDLRALPLDDESVTLAVSNYAFHHLDDRGKELALSEVRRVLVPGGRLVLCDMMFALTLGPRDRRLIAEKLRLLASRGPAGLLRIAKNGLRIATANWEHPAPPERWREILVRRRFECVSLELLEHEAGLALARRPVTTGGTVRGPASCGEARR